MYQIKLFKGELVNKTKREYKMKKKILITSIISIIFISVVVIIAYVNGFFYRPSEQQKRYMRELNEANAVVYFYGNPTPGKEIDINYFKVEEFTDETIGYKEGNYDYHAIVLLDFDGKMDLSNEELLLIKDYCEKQHYDLLYYGTAHMDQFQECGYFQQMDSTQCGFVHNGSYWKNRVAEKGYIDQYLYLSNWTEQDNQEYDTSDRHMMWKFIISMIVDLYKESVREL